jgi:hypothetical protein
VWPKLGFTRNYLDQILVADASEKIRVDVSLVKLASCVVRPNSKKRRGYSISASYRLVCAASTEASAFISDSSIMESVAV